MMINLLNKFNYSKRDKNSSLTQKKKEEEKKKEKTSLWPLDLLRDLINPSQTLKSLILDH
jgi:hypothetical protein